MSIKTDIANHMVHIAWLLLILSLGSFISHFFSEYMNDLQRVLLSLPLIITVPSIIGLASLVIIFYKSVSINRMVSNFSNTVIILILSYIIGSHILYIGIVAVFYMGLYHIISLVPYMVPLLSLCIDICLIIYLEKHTSLIKHLSLRSLIRSIDRSLITYIVYIVVLLWGSAWAFISRLNTPFPRLPPDIAGPFDFIQPMTRLFEYGFLGKTRVLLLILASFTSAYSRTSPECIVWSGTILLSSVYALGIFLLLKKLTDSTFISLLSAFLAIVLNKGTDVIFHSTVIHLFRYTTFVQALLPYIMLLFIWVVEIVNNERKNIILKWVNHLQELKQSGQLPSDLWITSSDNFASWGGGDASYHTDDLVKLLKAVDYVSAHTYPFHDTHYNAAYWKVPVEEENLTEIEKVYAAMLRAKNYAISQYQGVVDYMQSVGVDKPIHIGETGWSTESGLTQYGSQGSKATDEYKAGLYYKHMRNWTNTAGMSCFYFEAFDEHWKDTQNPLGSENHFGLITLNGQAKYAVWEYVDNGAFEGLTRNGKTITKTFNGDKEALLKMVLAPPQQSEIEKE